jgi:hypothetical protein
MPAETTRPLSALLSQVLVAFTLELDDEFEKQMRESGYAGASLSVVIWSALMRFLAGASPSVRNLAAQSLSSEKRVKFELGCLERWSFVTLEADPADGRPIAPTGSRAAFCATAGAAVAAFAPTGSFAPPQKAAGPSKSGRRCSMKSKTAGWHASARTTSEHSASRSKKSLPSWMSTCPMA